MPNKKYLGSRTTIRIYVKKMKELYQKCDKVRPQSKNNPGSPWNLISMLERLHSFQISHQDKDGVPRGGEGGTRAIAIYTWTGMKWINDRHWHGNEELEGKKEKIF